MQRQTLASALNAALKQQQARSTKVREAASEMQEAAPEVRKAAPEVKDKSNFLLRALLHSTTEMDKIVQRRIGLEQEPVFSLD